VYFNSVVRMARISTISSTVPACTSRAKNSNCVAVNISHLQRCNPVVYSGILD
jgi:hypothetical protein